jgi:hypothetical protein
MQLVNAELKPHFATPLQEALRTQLEDPELNWTQRDQGRTYQDGPNVRYQIGHVSVPFGDIPEDLDDWWNTEWEGTVLWNNSPIAQLIQHLDQRYVGFHDQYWNAYCDAIGRDRGSVVTPIWNDPD